MDIEELFLQNVNIKEGNIIEKDEDMEIEYKKTFNWNSKASYGKIMASFANNKGGFLVFGIDETNNKIVGLRNNNFKNRDTAVISQYLNETFSPMIIWLKHIIEIGSTKIGLLYTNISQEKPIIATKQSGRSNEIKQGDIYFRYIGQSTKINYSELKAIIDNEKQKVLEKLNVLLEKITLSGVDNIAILDSKSGNIEGFQNRIIIDESLVEKINFIKEGRFDEINGEPTLKLVGEIKAAPVLTIERKTKEKVILTFQDLVKAFLTKSIDPDLDIMAYIRQLCHESSSNFPVYYFISKSNINIKEIVNVLASEVTASLTKTRIISRIKENQMHFKVGKLTLKTKQGRIRSKFYQNIGKNKLPSIDSLNANNKMKYFLEAVSHLDKKQINSIQNKLFRLLLEIFEIYYSRNTNSIKDVFRRAICALDVQLYFQKFDRSIKI